MKYVKPLPKVGDQIYVYTSFYIDHGEDDFKGGLCTVLKVEEGISAGKPTHYITVRERPNSAYNWQFLAEKQAGLKKKFGNSKGHADPDFG